MEPVPCPLCDELPKVDGFLLMDMRTGWTCLCPNGHFETQAYYDRDGAVTEWNAWAESDGYDEGGGW
jgi:hypothetical protein